ncbi:MAG: hypothetical protein JNK89_04920 [Saprospiraceae bacterium]|nr:hypothetical protein [Saprospiraceae bacterium]
MIKDIPVLKVENLAMAVIPRLETEQDHELFWDAYLLNLKEEAIYSVLVNSTGYGLLEGEQRRTTTLRYFWDRIEPMTAVKVEPVQKSVLDLANEYWISFSFHDYLYDKKYVFVPGSLHAQHFTEIPLLQRKGVMIR